MSSPVKDPKVETNVFDIEEIHHNCVVQVLRNSITDEVSVGWWREGVFPGRGRRDAMTNAGRIRAMTDEKLAEFINDAEFGFLDRPGICDVCHTLRMKDCLSCWLEWLKQEAQE